jgi:mono/diheme cytochrome c family protein
MDSSAPEVKDVMNQQERTMSRLIAAIAMLLPLGAAHAAGASESPGEPLFRRYCVSCHGAKAEGDGPVAPFFKLRPPDLTRIAQRHGGEFPAEKVRRIIDGTESVAPHGAREMPVWGLELAIAEGGDAQGRERSRVAIGRLVDYLGTLQR